MKSSWGHLGDDIYVDGTRNPQPRMLSRPLPWWKRVPADAWWVAGVLVAAAMVCVWLMEWQP